MIIVVAIELIKTALSILIQDTNYSDNINSDNDSHSDANNCYDVNDVNINDNCINPKNNFIKTTER